MHGSVTVARSLTAPPSRVFAAFAELPLRGEWFRVPSDAGPGHHELDFRVGGGELARGTFAPMGVPEYIEYRSRFLDIVADQRIVFVYELSLDGRRRTISLVTVEIAASDAGTNLTYTEQYALVAFTGDGNTDVAHLAGSLRLSLNGLAAAVQI